jgi:hypothetical protein
MKTRARVGLTLHRLNARLAVGTKPTRESAQRTTVVQLEQYFEQGSNPNATSPVAKRMLELLKTNPHLSPDELKRLAKRAVKS